MFYVNVAKKWKGNDRRDVVMKKTQHSAKTCSTKIVLFGGICGYSWDSADVVIFVGVVGTWNSWLFMWRCWLRMQKKRSMSDVESWKNCGALWRHEILLRLILDRLQYDSIRAWVGSASPSFLPIARISKYLLAFLASFQKYYSQNFF